MSLPTEPQTWSRDDESFISTDKTLLSIATINAVFDADFMYWTKALPDDILQSMINNSFCFGLYKISAESTTQIGFARLVTDSITFAYLTNLFVLPEYQGLGLGGWLIDCVDALLSPLPHLRWVMLRTAMEKSKESYERRLGMAVLESGDISQGPVMIGKKGRAGQS